MTMYTFGGHTISYAATDIPDAVSASTFEISVNSSLMWYGYSSTDPDFTQISLGGNVSIRVNGVFADRNSFSIERLTWDGNQSIVLVYGHTNGDTSFIVLDGAPIDLPTLQSVIDFNTSITGSTQVTSGDYAPELNGNGILPATFASLVDISENDIAQGNDAGNRRRLREGDDSYFGMGGDDTVYGGTGKDTVYGGTGNDLIYGEDDNDRLFGDAGFDSLYGGAGIDVMYGGDLYDLLEGDDGNDKLYGGNDGDELLGGAGNDQLFGDAGNDWMSGGDGNDRLTGGPGSDFMRGDAGNDLMLGQRGNDDMTGGTGIDTFVFEAFMGRDIVRDFSAAEGDVLRIKALLVGGSLAISDAAVVATYAVDLGNHTRLDFGGGNSVLLLGVADPTALIGHIDVF